MSLSDYFPSGPGHRQLSLQQVGLLPTHHEPQEGSGGPTVVTADPSASCQAHELTIRGGQGFRRQSLGGWGALGYLPVPSPS